MKLLLALVCTLLGCMQGPEETGSRPRYDDTADSGSDTALPDDTANSGDSGDSGNSGDSGDSGDSGPTGECAISSLPQVDAVVEVSWDSGREDRTRNPVAMPYLSGVTAHGGIRTTNTLTVGNWTRITGPTLATGMHPISLGPDLYGTDDVPQIPSDIRTLAEIFKANGGNTRADICSSVMVQSEATRGAESLEVCTNPEANGVTAFDQFERSGEWLRGLERDGNTDFLWMHLFKPHAPYNSPAPECVEERDRLAAQCPGWTGSTDGFTWDMEYDAACKAAVTAAMDCDILQLDHEIEAGMALLEAISRETGLTIAVVFTNDHGTNLMEDHGGIMPWKVLGHHRGGHWQVLGAPFLVWWVGIEAVNEGEECVINAPTSQTDIAPTILNLAGLSDEAANMDGVSIFNLPKEPRVISSFSCDQGGRWSTATHVGEDGGDYHAVAQTDDQGIETWGYYNRTEDPEEATLLSEPIPEHVRKIVAEQFTYTDGWICN